MFCFAVAVLLAAVAPVVNAIPVAFVVLFTSMLFSLIVLLLLSW